MRSLADGRIAAGVRTAQLAEGITSYQTSGSAGPWVVLVHGMLTPSFAWQPIAEMLAAEGFRVLRYDQFGRGLSDRPHVRYDLDLYVTQLRELTDQLDITGMHLVGWSMGAVIAGQFAAETPDRVESLCLIAPGLLLKPPVPLRVLRRLPGAERLIAPLVSVVTDRIEASHLSNPERFPDYRQRVREQLEFPGVGASFASTVVHFPVDAGKDLTALGAHPRPVLLIWGDADRVTPYANSRRVLDFFRHARLLTVQGGRHAVHLDHAGIVHPAIADFIRAAS